MDFDTLHAKIPYISEGKQKSVELRPYEEITLAMPGRHADQTMPPGGDFVVMVTEPSMKWDKHQFTHGDLFEEVQKQRYSSAMRTDDLIRLYLDVIKGQDPDKALPYPLSSGLASALTPNTFLRAVQCLAIAEHRRYARFETQFGGRFLPFRFAAGIAEGLWTSGQAIDKQKKGRPGVEMLERLHGVPFLTQELMTDA